MSKFLYRTVKIDMRALQAKWSRRAGPSAKGSGVGAGVQLLQKGLIKLGELGLAHRTKRELEKLEPDIEKAMPKTGGVLVRVTTKQWKHPDPTGARAKGFMGASIAVTGPTPQAAIRKWYSRPRFLQGAPEGWVKSDQFLWVTRKAKKSPSFVRRGGQQGFDLDGDGKPDLFPSLVRKDGRLGFDLDGDGKPDFLNQQGSLFNRYNNPSNRPGGIDGNPNTPW